jgi:hypothetical protein
MDLVASRAIIALIGQYPIRTPCFVIIFVMIFVIISQSSRFGCGEISMRRSCDGPTASIVPRRLRKESCGLPRGVRSVHDLSPSPRRGIACGMLLEGSHGAY